MGAKEEALKKRQACDKVMYTENFSKYSFCNNYHELMEIIKKYKIPRICEYVFDALPVNFFYDIDIKEKANPTEFENYKEILNDIIDKTTRFFEDKGLSPTSVIVLKSHTNKKNKDPKKSFHIIFRIPNTVFTIPCCISITNFLWKERIDYMEKGIIDKSVLREGNFRSFLCSKKDEVRPFVRCKSFGSQGYDDVETFVQMYSDDAKVCTEEELGIEVNHTKEGFAAGTNVKRKATGKGIVMGVKGKAKKIKVSLNGPEEILQKFILEKYGFPQNDLSACTKKDSGYFFNVISTKYCHIKGAEHKSNGQFIYINGTESAQMCHDKIDCKSLKHGCILSKDFPDDLRILFNLPASKNTKSIEKDKEMELKAMEDCKEIVLREYDYKVPKFTYDQEKQMLFSPADKTVTSFRGLCPECCEPNYQIFSDGFNMECPVCQKTFPSTGLITWKKELYPSLSQHFNLTINNTIINNYNNCEIEFSSNVQIDQTIFNDTTITNLINQILSGDTNSFTRLMKTKYDIFAYDDKWYYFDGFRWKKDKDSLDFKGKVLEEKNIFKGILEFYNNQPLTEDTTKLKKNVSSLINKICDPGFKSKVVDEARILFREEEFASKLNCKKYLIPFTNGVYDLLAGGFRTEVKKDDYVQLTVGYDYDPDVNNPAVHDFLEKVLPDESVRHYMLKILSDCLDGDRPNTKFFFLIGVGSNGKTQLMNLMSQTMGQFTGKANGKMFTGKKPESDSATPSLMALKDKRFACASETEDGERINLALLKEITGSECLMQGRNLNENITEFEMQAKFFLCTNNLPEIKGEGPSVWRRIRVIDFPTHFVESPNPLKTNEMKADVNIKSKIKNDSSWKQTFFNILLSYYNRDIPQPKAVLARTEEYREETNEVEQWCKENIEFKVDGVLELTDLNTRRFGAEFSNNQEKGKFRKEVEKVLRRLGESVDEFEPVCKRKRLSGLYCQCWSGISLI